MKITGKKFQELAHFLADQKKDGNTRLLQKILSN